MNGDDVAPDAPVESAGAPAAGAGSGWVPPQPGTGEDIDDVDAGVAVDPADGGDVVAVDDGAVDGGAVDGGAGDAAPPAPDDVTASSDDDDPVGFGAVSDLLVGRGGDAAAADRAEPRGATGRERGPAGAAPESAPAPDPVVPVAATTLGRVPLLGDPGRQVEVVPRHGPLAVGVADTELDFVTVGPLEVRACSTRGLSHRLAGTPRQDMYCLAADDEWLVVAVADGVSDGRHSQVAAETAARAGCKIVLDQLSGGGSVDWVAVCARLSRRIVEEARYRRLADLTGLTDGRDQVTEVRKVMSTTAVMAVLRREPDESGRHRGVLAVLAGDSGAYRLDSAGLALCGGGKGAPAGQISSSSVHPLPGAATPTVLEVELGPGEALVVVSDGVGDPLGDGAGEVGQALARLWDSPPSAADFLCHVNFLRKTYDDDRTAVGVWVPVG